MKKFWNSKEQQKNELKQTQAYLDSGKASIFDNRKLAIQCYEKALEIARERGYKLQETQAHKGLGDANRLDSHNQAAIKHYEKSLKIAKEQGYKLHETEAYIQLGEACRLYNQHHTAILHFKISLKIAKEQGYKSKEIKAFLRLGDAYRCNNQNQTAIQHFEKALEIAREQGDKEPETQAYIGLGQCYSSRNENKAAIEHYEKASKITMKQGYDNLEEIQKKKKLSKCAESNNVADMDSDILAHANVNQPSHKASSSQVQETIVSWEERSIFHREKFINLREYTKTRPGEIREVNGVYVCCSEEFLIGGGSHGTCVYVGLGQDGVERAVKRLVRNTSSSLAKQEMKVLNEPNTKSKHVINYWFLEEQCDKDFLYLILDLCEETLENFVKRSSETDLARCAPDIIRHVLKGLADLHRDPNPILQRDLKPSNILRNIEGNWLLADFGISRIMAEGMTTHESLPRGTEDWQAVESCSSMGMTNDINVRYKKESDIQVLGMVAFYILTKGEHPFGGKPDRLRNLLDDKPVGLDNLKDDAANDLISWMLNHDPKDRPSAKEALKHPYLQPAKQQFEMLCKIGNQPEIKTQDVKSDVVRTLNSNPEVWQSRIPADVLTYLSTDCLKGRPVFYKPPWTDCLRLIRNVEQHWNDRPRPRPEVFYIVEDPQKYFLNLFPNLCVEVHKIVRSCDWKERDDLKEYFVRA